MTDEERLIHALTSADPKEPNATYERFYYEYKGLVAFVLSRYLTQSCDIDDLIQDTFLDFFKHADSVTSSIKCYLTSSAKNKALNHLTKNGRVDLTDINDLERSFADGGITSHHDYLALISTMRETLSKEECSIIVYHLNDDYSFKEIGGLMSLNENTVKTKYFRALKQIRKKIGG